VTVSARTRLDELFDPERLRDSWSAAGQAAAAEAVAAEAPRARQESEAAATLKALEAAIRGTLGPAAASVAPLLDDAKAALAKAEGRTEVTGNREQGTGDGEQGTDEGVTGNREQGTGNTEQGTEAPSAPLTEEERAAAREELGRALDAIEDVVEALELARSRA
jgi:hypothetical protein